MSRTIGRQIRRRIKLLGTRTFGASRGLMVPFFFIGLPRRIANFKFPFGARTTVIYRSDVCTVSRVIPRPDIQQPYILDIVFKHFRIARNNRAQVREAHTLLRSLQE